MNAEKEWPSILQLPVGSTISEALVERQYKKLAKRYHPDLGGTVDDMQQLNSAKQLALKWIATERTRQEQVKRYASQVAQVQQTQQSIHDAYAYQQQQFNQWASSIGSMGQSQAYGNSGQYAANSATSATHEPVESIKEEPKSAFRKFVDYIKGK